MKRNKLFNLMICPFVIALFALTFTRCDDKDEYYKRPDWLEPPIFTVLEEDGNFTKYLECVERTSYAMVLKGAGLYTVFAPNDKAFNDYLSQKGYSSVADIPNSEVDKIVAYSICNSTVIFDSIGVQGTFKYKSQYYALPYRDSEYNNEWVVDQTAEGVWTPSYNNYKFVTAFTKAFFNSYTPVLTSEDYNIFYPNVQYTGKNILAGEVLRTDMRAENGIVHEVSTVNLPMDNLADILEKPEHSVFKSLVDSRDIYGKYLFREYLDVGAQSATLLKSLQKIMPHETIDRIYCKFYVGLSYSLNLENVADFGAGIYSPETSGYTLILPSNQAINEYLSRRVLKYYTEGQLVPQQITQAMINAHMIPSLVWPANYALSLNENGDYLNGEGSTGALFAGSAITSSTLASNGFVHHTNEVIRSRLFESVYSEIFLNPTRSWLEAGYASNFRTTLREDLQKCALNGYISERYTMLVFDNNALEEDGFSYNTSENTFAHSTSEVNVSNRLTRLLREHIFAGLNNNEVNSEITDFSTAGISQYGNWNFSVTSYGDPVRYKDNQMQAAGNIEDNTFVNLTKLDETYLNGTVWSVDKMLQYSPRVTGSSDELKFRELTLWDYLNRTREQNPNVKTFVDYFQACIKTDPADNNNKALDGINTEQFYTILMPNTAAMNAAVTAGVLPPLADVVASNPEAFAKAAFFINSHIIQGRVFVDDNIRGYIYPVNPMSINEALVSVQAKVNNEALGITNQSLLVRVYKGGTGLLEFEPQDVKQGNTTLVTGNRSGILRIQRGIPAGSTEPNNYRSNRIACKAILHEINNSIRFTVEE